MRARPTLMLLVVVMAAAAACGKAKSPGEPGREAPAATVIVTPASPSGQVEVAILAGGCFWGMEEILRKIPGVLDTVVGYAGGDAEAVRVTFDPAQLRYADLLERWYFRMHDPTTRDRQGNDVGSQYRSAIFYTSPEQQRIAAEVRARIDADGTWAAPLVTTIEAPGEFRLAEDHHQDYLQDNPDGYTCHWIRP